MIECGGTPDMPDNLRPDRKFLGPDGKTYLPPFKNQCPSCKTFKQTQRPTSAGRIRQQGDFRIRKGNAGPRRIQQVLNKESQVMIGGAQEEDYQILGGQVSRISKNEGVTSLGGAAN